MPQLTTEQGVVQATRVADYVFTSPRPWMTFPILFLLSLMLGLIVNTGDLTSLLQTSTVLFFVPAVVSALLCVPVARGLGGTTYLRRTTLLALISLIIFLPFTLIWRFILEPHFSTRLLDMMLFSWALIFWLWHLVLLTTSHSNHGRTFPVSIISWALGLVTSAYWLQPFGAREIVLALGFHSIFLVSAAAFVKLAESPLRRNFGASGIELVKNMLAHWTEGGSAGQKGMEQFFRTFSVPFHAETGVVAFRKKDRALKGLWLFPPVHPGPFGMLGGSDLPAKLKAGLNAGTDNVMVFHGASTHDQNPESDEEVAKLTVASQDALKDMQFLPSGGPVKRNQGRSALLVQPLGNAVVAVHTSAPNPTDDVDFPVGRSVQDSFRRRGIAHPFFADAHNCLERGSGAVHFGTHEAEELLKQADEASSAYVKPDGTFKAGFAATGGFDRTKDGLGPQGIQVAVIEAGGQKMAYILLDGNNMVKGLREMILEAVRGPVAGGVGGMAQGAPLVDEAEVLSTDNHCVHATMGGYNPVGSRYPNDKLANMARETVQRAVADLEEVETGAASKPVDLRVFGHGNTARLTTAINSTVAVLKVGVATCLAFALFGAFLLHYLAGRLL